MPNLPGVVIAIASVPVILVVLLLAIRALGRRGGPGSLPAPPAEPGPVLAEAEGLYLATSPRDRPLERARIPELLYRDRAALTVHPGGVRVQRRDGVTFWVPAEHIVGAGRATFTIDRGVEPGGLTVLGWRAGDSAVESSFRLDHDATALIEAIESIRPSPSTPKELP
ncbi:MAG: hypothetical protein HY996_10380 [Micrococcales bacterium]|nr:hypothetical protein [Micrococcales bacterium]